MDITQIEKELIVARSQMAKAVQIAARKVEKQPKTESGTEIYTRIILEKEEKKKKATKRVAKTMVKKKQIKTLTSYFQKK